MAGFGQEGVQPLQVNAPPISTPATPVVTGPAVQQLIDSFRNGVISADDIIKAISVEPAKQKAEIQAANELVSPEAIAARKAAVLASGAQANLTGEQAQANQGLVQPTANLALAKTNREIADTKWGGGVSAYQQYAPYFGEPALIQDASGNPDYESMGKAGNGYMRTMAQQNFARMMLEPDPNRKETGVDPGTQQPVSKMFNKWGMEVTPGSPAYNNLIDVVNQTNTQIFGNKPGAVVPPTPSAAPAPPAISPRAQMEPSATRAELVNRGMPASQAVAVPDTQVQSLLDSLNPPVVGAPTERPTIQTQAPQSFGAYVPGSGMVTGPSKNLMTAPDIATDLRKQSAYTQWENMMTQSGYHFINTANELHSLPPDAPKNTLDMDLASSIISMESPGNAIREFKWDLLTKGQPFYERLKNFKSEALKLGELTPPSRERLIKLGYSIMDGKERTLLPHLQLAKQRAEASGAPLDQILTPSELKILSGGTLVPHTSSASSAPPPPGKTVTIPGMGTGIYDPRTGLFTRTQ